MGSVNQRGSSGSVAVRVNNLSKQYRLGVRHETYKTLRDSISEGFKSLFYFNGSRPYTIPGRAAGVDAGTSSASAHTDTIWALKNVFFNIKRGEVVGLIGRNGAGKSTLLKVLARITEPSEGQVEVHGRVGSLLEIGTGFHPELTGRENIFLSGVILGMKKSEIVKNLDEIVAFAEIEKFMDTPIKYYSSGMYMRLAFAVAAHLESEILLVDEVLAVGDAAFQKKCLGKMENVANKGRAVVFVSHNMAAVKRLCTRVGALEHGRLTLLGTVDDVVASYLTRDRESADSISLIDRLDRSGNGSLRLTRVTLLDENNETISVGRSGEPLTIALDYIRSRESVSQAVICLQVSDLYGQKLFMCLSRSSHDAVLRLPLEGQIRCSIPKLPLVVGYYYVSVWCKVGEQVAERIPNAFRLEVDDGDFFRTGKHNPSNGGSMLIDHGWEVI